MGDTLQFTKLKGLSRNSLDVSKQYLLDYEERAFQRGARCIVGVDEAGRGPLAGPVVAAACMFSEELCLDAIDDSKKLTPKRRASIFKTIKERPGILWGVGVVSHEIIDAVNIYQATLLAMQEAVIALQEEPDYLLVDGMQLTYKSVPCEKIIKGDAKSLCIAAASIIAKETRDALMKEYDVKWPHYGFAKHKGYPTKAHVEALIEWGVSPIHRKSFEPVKSMVFP